MGVSYRLANKLDGVYLTVTKDDNIIFPTTLEQLKTDLTKRKIPFEPVHIAQIFESTKGEEVRISKPVDSVTLKPIMRAKISQDQLKAYLIVIPFLEGIPLEEQDILEFLKEQHIVNGIKIEIIPEIITSQKQYKEWLIAEGNKSQDGENARLIFNFITGGIDIKPQELADGSVDFFNLDLIQNVGPGTVLVEKQPATSGVHGKNVFGEETRAKPGKDIRLPAGLNTQAIDNYSKLIATKDGHVVFSNGKVHVYAVYEVKGDVDFNTGNIRFNGNVIVHGNVKNNFEIIATGDVEIDGNLEGTVRTDGNIQVKKGIVRGKAYAGGSIIARYIENGHAECKENITIADAIMHSTTRAGHKVAVGGKKGLLVGGACSAGEEIWAKNIGAAMGTTTTLEVGIRPELREEYKEVCKKLTANMENNDKNQKIIRTLQEIKLNMGTLTEAKAELYLKANRLQYQINQEIEELSKRKNELEINFEEMENARITVEQNLYNGVTIYMGKSTYIVAEEMAAVTFSLDGLDIKYSSYKGKGVGRS